MPELLENRVDAIVSLPGQGITGEPFQTIAGGGSTTTESVRDRAPGERFDHELPNLPTFADLTVSRVFNTERDQAIHDKLIAKSGSVEGQVGKILRDLALNRAGLTTYTVLLKGVAGPDGDTNGNGKGMLTLTFAVQGVR